MVPVVVISASLSVAEVEIESDVEVVSCEDIVLAGKLDSSVGEDVVAVMELEAVIDGVAEMDSVLEIEDVGDGGPEVVSGEIVGTKLGSDVAEEVLRRTSLSLVVDKAWEPFSN